MHVLHRASIRSPARKSTSPGTCGTASSSGPAAVLQAGELLRGPQGLDGSGPARPDRLGLRLPDPGPAAQGGACRPAWPGPIANWTRGSMSMRPTRRQAEKPGPRPRVKNSRPVTGPGERRPGGDRGSPDAGFTPGTSPRPPPPASRPSWPRPCCGPCSIPASGSSPHWPRRSALMAKFHGPTTDW